MTEVTRFSLGNLDFDPRSGELSRQAQVRRLEPKAAAVLGLLCELQGAVVTRQELLDGCWGEGEGSDEALTQAIAQIRRALDELGEPGIVETLAKRGYRLNAGISSVGQPRMAGPRRDRPSRLILALLALPALGLLIVSFSDPHSVRHFIRHALGLGSPSSTH